MGKFLAHAIHQMNLRAYSEFAAGRSSFNHLDQLLCGPDSIRFLANFPAAFRMHDDLDIRMARAHFVDVFRKKSLMDRAVALPQNHSGAMQSFPIETSLNHERIPDHALVQRNAHGESSIAAQVLIRKKENLVIARKSPLER